MKHSVVGEARDTHGEWTRTGGDAAVRALTRLQVATRAKSHGLTDVSPMFRPSPSQVRTALEQHDGSMDDAGADGHTGALSSINIQTHAQAYARAIEGFAGGGGAPPPGRLGQIVTFWEEYQSPQKYGAINTALRSGKPPATYAKDAKLADEMFTQLGITTPAPMTVYRAIKSGGGSGVDWKKTLVPGATFQDNGMISTTAHPNFAEGWLDLPDHPDGETLSGSSGRTERSDDIVMEIHVPKGTRIVGGDPGFIETMLHPGTKFKIISASEVKSTRAMNPVTSDAVRPFRYTHVVAEVQP